MQKRVWGTRFLQIVRCGNGRSFGKGGRRGNAFPTSITRGVGVVKEGVREDEGGRGKAEGVRGEEGEQGEEEVRDV